MIGILLIIAGILVALFFSWIVGVILAVIGVVILLASAFSSRTL